ncbi:MAG: metallophosphoesterase [Bacteroidales bacterium]
MRSFSSIAFILIFLILIDLYVFKGLKEVIGRKRPLWKSTFRILYWVISAGFLAAFVFLYLDYETDPENPDKYRFLLGYNGVFIAQFVFKFFFLLFELARDLFLFLRWAVKSKKKPVYREINHEEAIDRKEFLRKAGIMTAALPFLGVIQGIGWGRFNFRVHHKKLYFKDLPSDFDGLRLVQLSDAHLGGFAGQQERLYEVTEIIRDLDPDLLVFTGDMVNNFASEMNGWTRVFADMPARLGKFSILGNHDYGDYSEWPSKEAKEENLSRIIARQGGMGFRVLRNEHFRISKNGSSVYLAGMEHWGNPPFPQYGDLNKTLEGIPDEAFTILLSHSPDHWSEQVISKTTVPLTLSGHTHGFQFGIEIGSFKISPVRLLYKHWAGLYQEGSQYLYVNRGLGILAFPGRVGIWPEITLLELYRG